LATDVKTIHAQAYSALITRLKEARKKAGITQTALAQELGHPQSFVSKYETRERLLDPIEYLEIALAIGMDPYAPLKECEGYLVPASRKAVRPTVKPVPERLARKK
jgi:transcriptional regulator with XRE-family HTH domain